MQSDRYVLCTCVYAEPKRIIIHNNRSHTTTVHSCIGEAAIELIFHSVVEEEGRHERKRFKGTAFCNPHTVKHTK